MPHIIVEYTRDIDDVSGLLDGLHDTLAAQETAKLEAIKTRALPLDHYVVGDRSKSSMVHVTLKLMPGRSNELKNTMTTALEAVVKEKVTQETSVTVESVELNAESYKH